jgi:Ca-activated chloride channel family protein
MPSGSNRSFSWNQSLLCLLLIVLFEMNGAAQMMATASPLAKPESAENDSVTTIRKRVDEVNLLFTVVDDKGRFVNKLTLNDFNLLDDKLPPERIRAFQQETDLPLRVALVVDISGSVTNRFKFEQKAAGEFFKKIMRPTDQAMVIGFNQNVHLVQDLTSNVSALATAVNSLRPDGETALFDALVFACNSLRRTAEPGTRKLVILISDGQNNAGLRKMYEADEAALRAEAPIYTLSTNQFKPGGYNQGEAVLELLSRYTGGELLRAQESKEVVRAFRQVEEALRSQYVVSYKPAQFEPNGSYRSIALTTRKSKLKVECRRGYFAPRD